MKKTFLGPHDRKSPVEHMENPYLNATQQHQDQLLSKDVQIRNAQRALYLVALIAVIAVIGCVYMSSKSSVVPFIVEVEASGNVRLVGKVTEQDWSIKDSHKTYILHRWIAKLRKTYKDKRPMVENFTDVRLHATPEGNMQLDQYMDKYKPLASKDIRTVRIVATTKIEGKEHAYRVEWQEKTHGNEPSVQSMVGEFHLKIEPPKTEEQMLANALGVYVSFFTIDKKR